MAKETSSEKDEVTEKREEMEYGHCNSQCGHNDWQRKRGGRCNGKEKDRCAMHTGDKVKGLKTREIENRYKLYCGRNK